MTTIPEIDWLDEARRYADHIYCYAGLVDDHVETFQHARLAGSDIYETVEAVGEKYDLDRADQNWGIHTGVTFHRMQPGSP